MDEKYMYRCFDLAKKAANYAAPNPMVGAVLVYQYSIIGEGYHQFYGGPHAEVNCIHSVEEKNKQFIPESTLYVSLEPCNHYGKTPPCTNLILQSGIKKVVIGCKDEFEKVNGSGIQFLQQHGIQVQVSSLSKMAKELNKRFFHFHTHKQPYIILKWAQSQNQIIGNYHDERLYITNSILDVKVHQWRSQESAIVVGTNTLLKDKPLLDIRNWFGKKPIRMFIDTEGVANSMKDYFVEGDIIFTSSPIQHIAAEVVICNREEIVHSILQYAYQHYIISILVEGGAKTHQHFINQHVWQEARIITNSNLTISKGICAAQLPDNIHYAKTEFIDSYRIDYIHNSTNEQ